MKIKVTQQDIEKGEKCMLTRCPIALAARRAFKKRYISVGAEMRVPGFGLYRLPMKARYFIHDFDTGRPVEPITFTVEQEK